MDLQSLTNLCFVQDFRLRQLEAAVTQQRDQLQQQQQLFEQQQQLFQQQKQALDTANQTIERHEISITQIFQRLLTQQDYIHALYERLELFTE